MVDNSDNGSLRFSFVGDVSFGDCLFCQGIGIRSLARKYHPQHFFSQVAAYLQGADFAFCNLETVLSRSGEDENRLASVDMRGDPECIESLKLAGFSVVNIANNHSAQHGPVPFQETIELLRSCDLAVVGLKARQNWHCVPVIIEKHAKKIGFLGYSFVHDRVFSENTPYAEGDDEKIQADLRHLRDSVDLLVVSVHWGLEFMDYPSLLTVQRAHAMAEAGADIVIGHHPHVLQGIEVYKNSVIAYSLGNFLFDMLWSNEYRETMILEVAWQSGQQLDWTIVPARIASNGEVIILTGDQKECAIKRVNLLSQKINDDFERYPLAKGAYEKEFSKKNNIGRIKSYMFFLRYFHHYKKRYLLQQMKRTIGSRVEDILNFTKK